MPFGLKNAGATYQRLVNKIFAGQIGRNMKVYVDDMLVKNKKMEDQIAGLEEPFKILKHFNTTRKLVIDDRHFMTDSRQNGSCHKTVMDS